MSSPDRSGSDQSPEQEHGENESQGPNLKLIYSLILLAMLAAIGFAALIVLPFYHRR